MRVNEDGFESVSEDEQRAGGGGLGRTGGVTKW